MSSFNQSITKTESEMQKLIQVVEDNKKRITDYNRKTPWWCIPLGTGSQLSVGFTNLQFTSYKT